MKEYKWVILFLLVVAVLIGILISDMNNMEKRCSGLVLSSPKGYVCTNIQRGELR
jgi:Na+/H+-translocating membrane pyrophosphatase